MLQLNGKILEQVVVKILNNHQPKENLNEINILKELSHDNIVKFFGLLEFQMINDSNLGMVIERCGPSLRDFINSIKNNKDRFNEMYICYVLLKLCNGLKYLHDNTIIHRDIKPENILFVDNDPKICDFGLAKVMGEEQFATTVCGTPGYIAPELFNSKVCTKSADIYSLGCCAYEMVTLNQYDSKDPKSPACERNLSQIIVEMLKEDPEQRPNLEYLQTNLRIIIDDDYRTKYDEYVMAEQIYTEKKKVLSSLLRDLEINDKPNLEEKHQLLMIAKKLQK